jgi:hypothetical protein
MPEFSDGPFSHVFFFLDNSFGWQTYTYIHHRVSPARTRLGGYVGINNFYDVYRDTRLVR